MTTMYIIGAVLVVLFAIAGYMTNRFAMVQLNTTSNLLYALAGAVIGGVLALILYYIPGFVQKSAPQVFNGNAGNAGIVDEVVPQPIAPQPIVPQPIAPQPIVEQVVEEQVAEPPGEIATRGFLPRVNQAAASSTYNIIDFGRARY